jgi:urease accessory protein
LSERGATGLKGNLRLVCRAAPQRGTFLAEQSFSAPIHLSKAYWDGAALLVNVINQTAGIFGGDSITAHVVVEPGAHVLLTSPSAARFHPSQGRTAHLRQVFEVRERASLEVFPEISIPQRDSRSRQETVIDVACGGELLYLETLAPGRVASGEEFAFAHYGWSTDVRVAGRLIHRERASISPGRPASLAGLRALFPASYYAGMVVVSPATEKWDAGFAREILQSAKGLAANIAASKLIADGWSIRILASDSLALRESIRKTRELIYARLDRRASDFRRNDF